MQFLSFSYGSNMYHTVTPVNQEALSPINDRKLAAFWKDSLGWMAVFQATGALGSISTKGDALDQSLLRIHELSQANMFDFFKHHEEGKTSGLYIYQQDRALTTKICRTLWIKKFWHIYKSCKTLILSRKKCLEWVFKMFWHYSCDSFSTI